MEVRIKIVSPLDLPRFVFASQEEKIIMFKVSEFEYTGLGRYFRKDWFHVTPQFFLHDCPLQILECRYKLNSVARSTSFFLQLFFIATCYIEGTLYTLDISFSPLREDV